MICSAIGRLRMGTMGLGRSQVSGLKRVPEPPAISTARIISPMGMMLFDFVFGQVGFEG